MCTLGVCYKANCMYCYFCLIHATECWIFSFHSKTYKKHAIYLLFFIIFLLLLLLLLLLCLLAASSSSSSLVRTNTRALIHSHRRCTKRTNEHYDIRNVVHSKFVMKMKEKKNWSLVPCVRRMTVHKQLGNCDPNSIDMFFFRASQCRRKNFSFLIKHKNSNSGNLSIYREKHVQLLTHTFFSPQNSKRTHTRTFTSLFNCIQMRNFHIVSNEQRHLLQIIRTTIGFSFLAICMNCPAVLLH